MREIAPGSLLIFDLDHTLTMPASGRTFRTEASDWTPIPGRRERLHALEGVTCAIATNQGGVAFGLLDKNDLTDEIEKAGGYFHIPPELVFICFSHPSGKIAQFRGEDPRRKPGWGMLRDAMAATGIPPEKTFMIGDRQEDEFAANDARCGFIPTDEFFS